MGREDSYSSLGRHKDKGLALHFEGGRDVKIVFTNKCKKLKIKISIVNSEDGHYDCGIHRGGFGKGQV